MNEILTTEVLKRLDALAEKLGVGAQYIFEALLRQQKIIAILTFVGFALASVCTAIGLRLILKRKDVWQEGMGIDDTSWQLTAAMVLTGLSGIATVVLIGCSFEAAARLLNPGYFAFKALANLLIP